jgi:peroxiredoxin
MKPATLGLVTSALLALALAGCEGAPSSATATPASDATSATTPATTAAASPATAKEAAADQGAGSGAAIGQPAPDFTLKDLDGKEVSLASLKGKTVVLEWFNPGCPFVKNSHGKASLKGFAKKATAKGDVVWLTINSAAPGKQGAGAEANREAAKTFGIENPILLDEDGKVGKAYGATNTPHMFVIDPKGTLVYAGAIDNSPDGEGESPEGGKLVNHVEQALAEIAAGKPVTVSRTKAYGCGVKYGS